MSSTSECRWGLVLAAALLGGLAVAPAAAQDSGAEDRGGAAMFRGGPTHPGVVEADGFRRLGGIAWRFQADAPIRSSPVVFDGTVYFGSTDHRFYAVDADRGTEVWRYEVGAEVAGAAAVTASTVVFIDRANVIHALDRATGRPVWLHRGESDVPLAWGHEGWDYILASPTIVDGTVLAGTGDGRLYALGMEDGDLRWSFPTGGRIRSAPAVHDGVAWIGSGDGWIYGIDLRTGRQVQRLGTDGLEFDAAEAGFDRTQIYSSPAIRDGVLYIGSRDAADYAFRIETGERLWQYREGTAWVIASPAVGDARVYTGRSSDGAVYALERVTGEPVWKIQTGGLVFSSPLLAGGTLYVGSGDRHVHALDATTGETLWTYRTEGQVLSTPTLWNGRLIIGSDDGSLYAFRPADGAEPRLAVYWDDELRGSSAWGAADRHEIPADFFANRGYERINGDGLLSFLTDRIADGAPSAVVVAMDGVPDSLVTQSGDEQPLLRRYLEAGGKVVWLGFPPAVIVRDEEGSFAGIDRDRPTELLGVDHSSWDTDEHWMRPTVAGHRWGLTEGWVGYPGVAADVGVTALATDDRGRAGFWVRSYGGPEGTGFVFARLGTDIGYLRQLRRVVEYGVFTAPAGR